MRQHERERLDRLHKKYALQAGLYQRHIKTLEGDISLLKEVIRHLAGDLQIGRPWRRFFNDRTLCAWEEEE